MPWARQMAEALEKGFDAVREQAEADAAVESAEPESPLVVTDLQVKAAKVTYPRSKRIKRTRYRPVDLSSRHVVAMVHQTGTVRGPASTQRRAHYTTAHFLIGPEGAVFRLHPLTCRLVGGNAIDRAPYHGIHIEMQGNFEGTDGAGDWHAPDSFGRGRASDVQLLRLGQVLDLIASEVEQANAKLHAVAPHRVTGRDKRGKPNRPICPGSRVWKAAESWALAAGVAVPGESWTLGGSPIPAEWRTEGFVSAEAVLE